MPFKLGIWLRRVIYKPFFKSFGKNVHIYDAVVIKYPDAIELGDNVTINQFCYIAGLGGLSIGNDVMIGAGSKIATSKHNYENTNKPMSQQGISTSPINIASDVWFGFNVVVLGGSKIAQGSILAANAVINQPFEEPYSIIGGVPGKMIGKRNN